RRLPDKTADWVGTVFARAPRFHRLFARRAVFREFDPNRGLAAIVRIGGKRFPRQSLRRQAHARFAPRSRSALDRSRSRRWKTVAGGRRHECDTPAGLALSPARCVQIRDPATGSECGTPLRVGEFKWDGILLRIERQSDHAIRSETRARGDR